MREHWHPSIKLQDIIEKTVAFVDRNATEKDDLKTSSWLLSYAQNYAHSEQSSPVRKVLTLLLMLRVLMVFVITLIETFSGS